MNQWKLPASALLLMLTASSCSNAVETSPPPGDVPASCSAAAVSGVEVTATDFYGGQPYALGYPPYSIDGCLLAYVTSPDAPENAGALLVRGLGSGEMYEMDPASVEPRRPSFGANILAWEATIDGRRAVRVHFPNSTVTVTGPFDHAGEPRASGYGVAGSGVVFTGWLTANELGDTDVFLYRPGFEEAIPIATGPGQQRFADISGTHIAFTDFAEDPDGQFNENGSDLADIAIYDRLTEETSMRARAGKQAFPLLGAEGRVAYLSWGPDHPEPKLSEYNLLIGEINAPPGDDIDLAHIVTSAPYIRPTARGRLVEWVDWAPGAKASLLRRPADASEPAEVVPGLDSAGLYGPCSSEALTVVAAQAPGGKMQLAGIDRPAP